MCKRHAYRIVMGHSERKRLIGTVRYRDNIIKMGLKSGLRREDVDCMGLIWKKEGVKCRHAVMKLLFPK